MLASISSIGEGWIGVLLVLGVHFLLLILSFHFIPCLCRFISAICSGSCHATGGPIWMRSASPANVPLLTVFIWSIEACHRHCPKSFRDEGGYHIVNIVNNITDLKFRREGQRFLYTIVNLPVLAYLLIGVRIILYGA